MTALSAVRLPIEWGEFEFPSAVLMGTTTLTTGDSGWGWGGASPELPIATLSPTQGEQGPDGWGIDHVVVMVADLDKAVEVFAAVGMTPRLRTIVAGRPMAFFRAGPVVEVVESPVRDAALYGLALVTDVPLEVLALRWRGLGHEVSDPKPAIQSGRRIMTVRGLGAGLAVMSPDRALL